MKTRETAKWKGTKGTNGTNGRPMFQYSNTPIFHSARSSGFTLMELLAVISIIGILAGIILFLGPAISAKQTRSKVQTQMEQLITVIDSYHAAKGFYPPDNPNNNPGTGYHKTSLYYELTGQGLPSGVNSQTEFGVGGILNTGDLKEGNATQDGKDFFKNIKDTQFMDVGQVRLLGVKTRGPGAAPFNDFCPWQYRVAPSNLDTNTAPDQTIHNRHSYDLWVTVLVNGVPQTFGNWREKE